MDLLKQLLMKVTDLRQWLSVWLAEDHPDGKVEVDGGLLHLQRRDNRIYAFARLSHPLPLSDSVLQQALRISAESLRHFKGQGAALVLEDPELALIYPLDNHDIDSQTESIEQLLNQRDVWQNLLHSKLPTNLNLPLASSLSLRQMQLQDTNYDR